MLTVPITTERLRIRAPEPADLDSLRELYVDSIALQHIGTKSVWSEAQIQEFDKKRIALADCGYTAYTVELKNQGVVIGFCGLFPDEDEILELTAGFIRRHWGNRYQQEAMHAIIPHAQMDPSIHRLSARFESDHPARAILEETCESHKFVFQKEAPHPFSKKMMLHYTWTAPRK